MKYHIWTLGCQYNEWDASRLDFLMQKLGFKETEPNNADVIIILACAVRQTAVDRVFGKINNWQKLRSKNQETKEKKNNLNGKTIGQQTANGKPPAIIISGCILDKDKEQFEKKDIEIFEVGDIKHLLEILSKNLNKKFEHFKLSDFYSLLAEQNTQSMYVPITMGCNNFCSYCAVPYTRGREKSRPFEEIICDVKKLIDKKYKEIMLLGQNVNSYKISNINNKIDGISDFTILLRKLNQLDGNFIISFTSNHPKDMTDDIIEAVATLPKIKKQIHLPIQSGSDKILRAMNRPYTKKQYLNIVQKIKLSNIKIDISTDVIVGFPGETEEDFQETVKVFKQVGYDVAYINKYSPRIGTAAYKLGDPIPWSEKQRRWRILNNLIYKK